MKKPRPFDPDDVSTLPLVELMSAGRPIYAGQVNPVWMAMVQAEGVTEPAISVALKYVDSRVKVAIELGCSLSAIALKIPVPRGMLVRVDPTLLPELLSQNPKRLATGEVLCFASILRWPERNRPRTGDPAVDDHVWKRFCESASASPSAAWDELVANDDRHSGNFVLDSGRYWLIDHDHALRPLAEAVRISLGGKESANLVKHRAKANQVAAQLVQRRPTDHGILDQPKLFSSRSRALDALVATMHHWRSGDPEIDAVLSDTETVVRGIILRLPPLGLLLDARLSGPISTLQWTSQTKPLFTP